MSGCAFLSKLIAFTGYSICTRRACLWPRPTSMSLNCRCWRKIRPRMRGDVRGMTYDLGRRSGGLAEWIENDTAFLSVAFTWRLNEAYSRACWYRAAGYKVRAGGPGSHASIS
jgi:hypothetical protein